MKKRSGEIAVSGLLAASFFAGFLVIPLFGPLVSVAAATPIILTGTRRGGNTASKASVVGTLFFGLCGWLLIGGVGVVLAILFALMIGLPASLLSAGLLRGHAPGVLFTRVVVVTGAVQILTLLVLGLVRGGSPVRPLLTQYEEMHARTRAVLEETQLSEELVELVEEGYKTSYWVIENLYPGLLGVLTLSCLMFGFARARRIRSSGIYETYADYRFSITRLPEGLVWLFILATVGVLVLDSAARFPFQNLLLMSVWGYLIQGMAVLSHFMTRIGVAGILKYLFLGLIITQVYLLAALALLGLFDIWLDFRKLKT